MKLRSLTIALMAAATVVQCQSDRKSSAPIHQALQAGMDESMPNSGAIGVSAAVIFPDGRMWEGASGLSHEGVPITTDMLFDIGSVQKNLQATLTLSLVQEGLIELDDPLEKWFPSYPNINGRITIRQLLNMTSGIDNVVDDPTSPWRIGYPNIQFEKIWTWEDVYSRFIGKPRFEPGTKCDYSSTNYIILKHVLEKATQSNLPAVFKNRLLKPLHLDHTVVDFSNPIPDSLPLAHGWVDSDNDGHPEDISGDPMNWVVSLAPMLVYSTPEDMVMWIDALFHKKRILKDETLKKMLAFISPVQNEPLMKGYGLGVVDINIRALIPKWENVRVYGHLGSQFGYTTFAGYFRDYGISMVIMSNRGCDRDSERAIVAVSGALLDVLFKYLGVKESKRGNSVSDMIEILKTSPGDVHLMYQIAQQHQANHDDYEASLVYEEILKRDPENKYGYKMEALFWKASYDGMIWKKPENLITFISEHKDYKDIKNAYKWLAKTYLRREEMDKAVQVYREALIVFGKDAELYNDFAWWVYQNKIKTEYETAIRYAKTAVEMKPEAYWIWDTLAWLYYENGEQKLAVEASVKALSLAPDNVRDEYEKSLLKIEKSKN